MLSASHVSQCLTLRAELIAAVVSNLWPCSVESTNSSLLIVLFLIKYGHGQIFCINGIPGLGAKVDKTGTEHNENENKTEYTCYKCDVLHIFLTLSRLIDWSATGLN